MTSKKLILGLVISLLVMAAISAFLGQMQGAVLCAVMAGIGALIVVSFKKGSRSFCVVCGESAFVAEKIEREAKDALQAAGWRWNESGEHCPACAKGVGNSAAHVG